MKKIVLWAAAFLLLWPIVGRAEEIAGIQMQIDQCNYNIWAEESFVSVKVPEGEYVVGVDIPAGQYYAKSASETIACHVIAQPYDIDTYEISMQLYHPRNWSGFYKTDQKIITLENGDKFCIQQAAVLFVPVDYVADFTGSAKETNKAVLTKYSRIHQELRNQIKNSSAWQEGSLPEGIWEIGKAVPAQKWTLTGQGNKAVTIYLGNERFEEMQVYPERVYEVKGANSVSLDLSEWTLIQIVGGAVKVETYAGHDLFDFE